VTYRRKRWSVGYRLVDGPCSWRSTSQVWTWTRHSGAYATSFGRGPMRP